MRQPSAYQPQPHEDSGRHGRYDQPQPRYDYGHHGRYKKKKKFSDLFDIFDCRGAHA
jgi:Zn-finger nucleic acid-binding protein